MGTKTLAEVISELPFDLSIELSQDDGGRPFSNEEIRRFEGTVDSFARRMVGVGDDGVTYLMAFAATNEVFKALIANDPDAHIATANESELRWLATFLWKHVQRQHENADRLFGLLARSHMDVLAENARKGSAARAKNPLIAAKNKVMEEIEREWQRRKASGVRFTATKFAYEMAKRHSDIVTVEAIKNAQTQWNAEYHPAS